MILTSTLFDSFWAEQGASPEAVLADVSRIAREAGAMILAIYHSDSLASSPKEDGSPVTAADRAAHACIVAALTTQYTWPVLSEEGGLEAVSADTATYWLVDPLDGTRDFLDRNDEFTVNIALIHHGVPVLGVLHAPALDEHYVGAIGLGVWREQGGRREILPRSATGRQLARSRHHVLPEDEAFARANGLHEVRAIGSALKFGRLLAGEVAIYPRFAGSSAWDIAAGDALLRCAGYTLLALPERQPIHYRPDRLRNPPFIALASHISFSDLRFPA
jgi:3'(2'), 5'-bisphosphate nucleotidase